MTAFLKSLRKFLLAVLCCIRDVLAMLPLVLLLVSMFLDEGQVRIIMNLIPAATAAGLLLGWFILRRLPPWVTFAAALAAGVAESYYYGLYGEAAICYTIIVFVFFGRGGMTTPENPRYTWFFPYSTICFVSILCHILILRSFYFFNYAKTDLEQYISLLQNTFPFMLVLAVFTMNYERVVITGFYGDNCLTLEKVIGRRNLIITVIFIVFTAVVASVSEIVSGLWKALNFLLYVLMRLIIMPFGIVGSSVENAGMAGSSRRRGVSAVIRGILNQTNQDSTLNLVIGRVVAAILGMFAIYLTAMFIIRLSRWIIGKIRNFNAEEQSAFRELAADEEDEVTSLLEESLLSIFRKGRRQRTTALSYGELTDNRDRIRYIYRHYLKNAVRSGYVPNPAYTPREICRDIEILDEVKLKPGKLPEVYEKARYSHEEVGDDDVEKVFPLLGGEK